MRVFEGAGADPACGFFSFFAQRSPQALQSVLGPLGPLRHSGESITPLKKKLAFSEFEIEKINTIHTTICANIFIC